MTPLTVRYTRERYLAFALWAFAWFVAIAIALHLDTVVPRLTPHTRTLFWAVIFPCCILVGPLLARFYSTRVTVTDDDLTIDRWAARPRIYRLSDLSNFKIVQDSEGSRTAVLSFADGHRLTVSGSAQHFDDLRERLETGTPATPAAADASPIVVDYGVAFPIGIAGVAILLCALPYLLVHVLTPTTVSAVPLVSVYLVFQVIVVLTGAIYGAIVTSFQATLTDDSLTLRQLFRHPVTVPISTLRQVVLFTWGASLNVGLELPTGERVTLRAPLRHLDAFRASLEQTYGPDKVQKTWRA
jgi:hypothetical protein